MSKKLIPILIIVLVIVVIIGVWMGLLLSGVLGSASNPEAASPYSAVYLTTGDVYFGKLSWFPSPHLTDVWTLEHTQDANGQTQTGVVPFKSVFWGPVDEINIDAKQIIFWTKLKNGSQLVQAIENPTALQQGTTPAGQTPSGSTIPATSTSTGK